MNTFMNGLTDNFNYARTENGALTHKSTRSAVYDMFALCAAYRTRSVEDCILMFKNAFEEDANLAMKCLFYIADCRGGQGERRFFRVCFKWLANNYPETARKNLEIIPEYRRWDDLIYATEGTKVEKDMLKIIKHQLALDVTSKTPSLLAKWLPSENASSNTTRAMGDKVRKYLGWTHKEYRKALSELRTRINIVEKLMSQGRWNEIEFDKIPSKAGLVYKNAFARRDIIAKKYESFAKDEKTKVNADTLYPYEVVAKATNSFDYWGRSCRLSSTDRAMIEKYWKNLPDYFGGKQSNILCVVDTSGSMQGHEASAPINVAISLGMYCAERAGGPFKNHYISFSSRPQLIKIEGVDFVDKVHRIYQTNLCENTDLIRTFNMLLETAKTSKKEDIPDTIVVISDMEIDSGSNFRLVGYSYGDERVKATRTRVLTEMESMRARWAAAGLKMPKLVYWNVEARNNNILDDGPNVSYVSGMSPTIFKQVITGKTGWDLMIEAICAKSYEAVTA